MEQPFYFPEIKKYDMKALYSIRQKDSRVFFPERFKCGCSFQLVSGVLKVPDNQNPKEIKYMLCISSINADTMPKEVKWLSINCLFPFQTILNYILLEQDYHQNTVATDSRNFRVPNILQSQIFAAVGKE